MPTVIPSRPIDATLSVTKAARLLGVHPNTIRAWSDAGRLRYYRINPRGDRRYRLTDLQRFLAAAESGLPEGATDPGTSRRGHGRPRLELLPPVGRGERAGREPLRVAPPPATEPEPVDVDRQEADRSLLVELTRIAASGATVAVALSDAATAIRDHGPHRAVAVFELRGEWLHPAASSGRGSTRLVELPRTFGVIGDALAPANAGFGRRPGELGLVDDTARNDAQERAAGLYDVPGGAHDEVLHHAVLRRQYFEHPGLA